MNSQAEIRTQIQSMRQSLSQQQQTRYSSEICQTLIQSGILDQAQHIAFYLPVRGEANPMLLQQHAPYQNKHFYLPLLSELKENHLAFAQYTATTPMRPNRFKIPEPDIAPELLLHDPSQLDAIIMPLVGVDEMGNRIGMGGGFYDRTFAFKKSHKQTPLLIAFAYDFQYIAPQRPQDWDVPVDAIALQHQFLLL